MYIRESYKNASWIYKVEEDGLLPITDVSLPDIWTWETIRESFAIGDVVHGWDVLTDGEAFLELI